MAVLIEGISVVIKNTRIFGAFESIDNFIVHVPNQTFCHDGELCRIGFMHPDDVRGFIQSLNKYGLIHLDNSGISVDISVVDQHEGVTAPCDWLETFLTSIDPQKSKFVRVAKKVGSYINTLSVPVGWVYENSLTTQSKFIRTEDIDDELKFIKSEGRIQSAKDKKGILRYIGRIFG